MATLALGACGDDDDDSATTTTTTTEAPATSDTTTTGGENTVTTTTEPPAPANLVEVTVAGGEVVGGAQRVSVPIGSKLTIRVTPDVDDEVHVHGYDITQAVTARQSTDITFVADLGGVWEVELHDLDIVIVELEVS